MRLSGIATAVAAALSLVACGGGGSSSSSKKVTTNSVTSSGDVKMSGSAGLKDDKLALTLSAIKDPDDPSQPADPAKAVFDVAVSTPAATALLAGAAAEAPFTCSVARVSSASGSKIDLVFINDTTGSMSGTVLGIASSIQTFAESVAGSGVDAKFSMYTYGDAFATKLPSGSEFTKGKGDFALEGDIALVDDTERPYVGLSDLSNFKSFLTELTSSSALGTGGNDSPENTVGALGYAYSKVAWRDGAAKVFIAIGDNPSHQEGDGDVASYPASIQPTTGAALVTKVSGDATVHVVGNDTPSEAPYYNLKDLADGTGGGFIELPGSGVVDLSALKMEAWLSNSFAGACSGAPSGHYLVVVSVSVTGSLGTVKTGTLTFDITIP